MKNNYTDDRKRAGSSFADDGGVEVVDPRNRILVDDPGVALQENRIVRDSIDLVQLVILPEVHNPAQADMEQRVAGQIQVILHAYTVVNTQLMVA